ncbi:MAG: CDP-alcohol phosphatidyltransferase family protein [Candidatus Kerfeldbacteria bacterium]|nr:CDP-alcohol phosphatidyltransferase family protein [Candidatus Kerfeldbacteria bacterium]
MYLTLRRATFKLRLFYRTSSFDPNLEECGMHRTLDTLRSQTAALWTRSVDQPMRYAVDRLRDTIDAVLDWFFKRTPPGRLLFRHLTPDDWTSIRMFASPAPMVLILFHRPWAAIATALAIWSTDVIDGYVARKKKLESESGMKFETSVDTAFNLQTFIGVSIVYRDVRDLLAVAGLLELVRLAGGIILRRFGYDGRPNRSGKVKTWGYVVGTCFRLIAPAALAQLFLVIGIALSVYSMVMHLIRFLNEFARPKPRH